ncbi:tyrosine-type recombinase/integrase [Tsukamurella pseudospumae]|uniref:tyrosine-type recombinase/integrase n=1 Tax=Tsukamurella pseudospumae TaxID=239498 RepID=UPI001585E214|nr:site-specific integrase [Tsukamurella pseudospumae]
MRKLPSGRYQARYTGPDGRAYPAGSFGTSKQAELALAKIRTAVDEGRWLTPEQEAAAAEVAAREAEVAAFTVADLAEVWLATLTGHTHSTLSRARVEAYILPVLGHTPLQGLTPEQCRSWWDGCCLDKPSQRVRCYEALAAMLAIAVDRGLIAVSPLRIKGAKKLTPAREGQTASLEELDRLTEAMSERDRATILIAAWCGLRAGEVLGLQRADIVADPSTPVPLAPSVKLKIRRHIVPRAGGTPAGEKSFLVVRGSKAEQRVEDVAVPPHIVPEIWRHLDRFADPEPSAWMFRGRTHPEDPLLPITLRTAFGRARKAVSLPNLVFHDLRRTGNTLAAEAGATPAEMRDRLRHKSSEAAERYIVAARGSDVRLAERMSAAVTPKPSSREPRDAVDPVEVEVQRRVAERMRELGIDPE